MRLLEGAIAAGVVALGAASWVAFDRSGASQTEAVAAFEATCTEAYAWVDRDGAVVDARSERVLASSGALRACLPGPGVLALRVRGSVVAGTGAYAVVALGLENLWEGFVTDPIDLRLDVPHGGPVLLAFVNDRYEPPEDRNLWISDVVFTPR